MADYGRCCLIMSMAEGAIAEDARVTVGRRTSCLQVIRKARLTVDVLQAQYGHVVMGQIWLATRNA